MSRKKTDKKKKSKMPSMFLVKEKGVKKKEEKKIHKGDKYTIEQLETLDEGSPHVYKLKGMKKLKSYFMTTITYLINMQLRNGMHRTFA